MNEIEFNLSWQFRRQLSKFLAVQKIAVQVLLCFASQKIGAFSIASQKIGAFSNFSGFGSSEDSCLFFLAVQKIAVRFIFLGSSEDSCQVLGSSEDSCQVFMIRALCYFRRHYFRASLQITPLYSQIYLLYLVIGPFLFAGLTFSSSHI